MNLSDTTAFLTWLSQTDGRIQVTEPNVEVWANALGPFNAQEIRASVLDHYRTNETVMPTPAGIRKLAHGTRERALAKQSAITAAPSRPDLSYDQIVKRTQRPEFREAFERGRREGNAERAYNRVLRETGSQEQAAQAARTAAARQEVAA